MKKPNEIIKYAARMQYGFFHIETFGCQMNTYDSDLMAKHLSDIGLAPAETLSDAHIVIINTCSIRQHAEDKACSYIGRLKPYKMAFPGLKVILAGCSAQRAGEELKKRFPIIDMVIGAKDIEMFPKLFTEMIQYKGIKPHSLPDDIKRKKIRKIKSNVSAFVTIMRGCNNFCSYCIVPYVRGAEKSRPAGEIISEIKQLVKKGLKEVTLLGQNVNSYKDKFNKENAITKKSKNLNFPDLLEKINEIKGLERIRFMTSHPKDTGTGLISAISRIDKVCNHLHLPLQSGSDRILKGMNRKYSAADYFLIVEKLRKKIPGISLSTDIIVGFPGERQSDFKKTLDAVNNIKFDFIFAFKYSPRPGTKAAALKDDVPLKTKENRLSKILEATNDISSRKNAALMGTRQEILVEQNINGSFSGRTSTNKKVFFISDKDFLDKFVMVNITRSKPNSLAGDVCAK